MIREINAASALCALAVGSAFNVTLVWLIWRKSPAEMRVYSRILLQTCGADLLMLLATAMTQPIYTMDNGVGIVLLNGPFRSEAFGFLSDNCWLFLWDNCFFFAFFGFTAQFVFRYLTLTKQANISTAQYFVTMLSIVGPLVFVLSLTLYLAGNQAPQGDLCCENPLLLQILDYDEHKINLAQKAIGNWSTCAWLVVSVCVTIAYGIMFWCTHKMLLFVRCNLDSKGCTRSDHINRQLTLNMFFQSLLPFLGLVPILTTLAVSFTRINISSTNVLALELIMLIRVPMHWTPVFNPIVTILTVKHYNRAFRALFRQKPKQPSVSPAAHGNLPTINVGRKLNVLSASSENRQTNFYTIRALSARGTAPVDVKRLSIHSLNQMPPLSG